MKKRGDGGNYDSFKKIIKKLGYFMRSTQPISIAPSSTKKIIFLTLNKTLIVILDTSFGKL